MPIPSKSLGWKSKRIQRDFRNMFGMLNGTGQGTGGPVSAAHSVSTSEQTIVQVGAAGDEFYDMFLLPWDINRNYPVRWRLIFTHSSTDADTPTFTFDYEGVAEGEAMADITSHESTTFSGAVSTTANALEVTDWVSTASSTYITSSDIMLKTRVTATNVGGASANEIELIALELEYIVDATRSTRQGYGTFDTVA
jgi:uncharacterized protein YcnI